MKKRILTVALCIALLSVAVAILASCGGGGEPGVPTPMGNPVAVDMSDYTIVYAADLTTSTRQATSDISTRIKQLTGVTVRAWQDEEEDVVGTDDYEILVGMTNRNETYSALGEIGDSGWIIAPKGNKIVIVGTSDFLTRVAMTHFINNYLVEGAAKGSSINVQKVLTTGCGKMEMSADVDGVVEGLFDFVYDNRVDAKDNGGPDAYDYASDANPTTGGPDVDPTYTVVDTLRKQLASLLGVRASTMPNKEDTGPERDFEILVGNMDDRADLREELNKLEADEYGISIKNGKIMILAWNEVTLDAASQLAQDMFKSCIYEDDDGNVVSDVPAICFIKMKLNTDWAVDFPKPDGENIVLDGTRDVGDNSLEYIYIGDGVNNASYLAYCEKLEAAGYETIADESVWEGSTFRTYLNEEKGITLHVYHSLYQYADNYSECKNVLTSIRIVSALVENVDMPDSSILSAGSYFNRTQTKITSLKLNVSAGSFGNSYIITLADGSFIIYDGGLGKGGTVDLDNTWAVLNALYKEAFNGQEPTSANPIHVRAWILSHEHGDHSTVFTQFLTSYGKNPAFRLDNFLFNGISETERVNSNNPGSGIYGKHMTTLKNKVNGGFDHIKMHTGQTFYFANMKMEILYTHEDSYPKRLEYFNNSSTIFRTTFMDTGETMIWLGDSERIGGAHILGMYGPTLDSDMVQVAHHGWNGVTTNTYDVIAPEVVWWPTSISNFNGWTKNPNHSQWFKRVDHDIAYNVVSVELILIADQYNTTMIFTADSNDYDTLYDVVGGKEIVYCELSTNIQSAVVDKRIEPAS